MPPGSLKEFVEVASGGCAIGPNVVDVAAAAAGKTIVVFALPGAFTPTCSAKHAPGYIAAAAELKAAGVDEIWCVSVNDVHVMGAWARDLKAAGAVRFLADGEAEWVGALGLTQYIKSFGIRSKRYSMLIVDGVVRTLNMEAPGKLEASDAGTALKQARALAAAPK